MSWVILAALTIAYFAVEPYAFSQSTIASTINDTLPLIVAGAGETIVILAGGIDLSVGAVMSFVTALVATHMVGSVVSMLEWSLAAAAFGAVVGIINGLFIERLHLSPFIMTLASLQGVLGLALVVLPSPGGSLPASYVSFWTGQGLGGLSNGLIVIVVMVLAWLAFKRTRLGLWIYAVGSDREASRVSGVPVRKVTVSSYVLSGVLAGIGGLVLASQLGSGDPVAGNSLLLDAVAVVIIGGTAVTGGRGGFGGTVAGALILSMLSNVLFALHVSPFLTPFFVGLAVVTIVAVGVVAERVARRRLEVREV